jgi:Dyp-type peroxidase family
MKRGCRVVLSEADSAAALKEPVLALNQIQGNILLEFAKIYQTVICLRLKDDAEDAAAVPKFKQWLSGFRGQVTRTADVYDLRQRAAREFERRDLPSPRAGSRRLIDPEAFRLPRDAMEQRIRDAWLTAGDAIDGDQKVWTQIGFSHACLKRLDPSITSGDYQFQDQAFTAGMAEQSGYLGDPQRPADAPGNPANWKVGGRNRDVRADVFLLIASDFAGEMRAAVKQIKDAFAGASACAVAHYCEEATLVDMHTPEHFGHCDGFSQPGVLGLTPAGNQLTQRRNPLEPIYEGNPGQQLIWPGSFVLGYVNQAQGEIKPSAGNRILSMRHIAPEWARDGSYLVFRRLKQDVAAYRAFLTDQAADVRGGEAHLAAMLMGRWRNGAPIIRAPEEAAAVKELTEPCTSNHFNFQTASPQLPPKGPKDPWCSDFGDGRPEEGLEGSPGNRHGDVCPFIGHIRKMYPRDDTTGEPHALEDRRLKAEQRRILRRGLRYGTYCDPADTTVVPDDSDRGLLFLAYQASIQEQFLWLVPGAANGPDLPAGAPPRLQGWDPIVGQNPASGANRERCFPIVYKNKAGKTRRRTLTTTTDWVIPTGGEYFFVPSCDGLTALCRG